MSRIHTIGMALAFVAVAGWCAAAGGEKEAGAKKKAGAAAKAGSEKKDRIPKKRKGMPLVYQQDFEKADVLKGWVMTDDKAWKIVEDEDDKSLSLFGKSKYKPPVRSPLNIARIKDLNVSDFILEAKMKQTGRAYGHRDMCLFFGYNDPSHFYYVHIATASDAHANSIFLVNAEPRVSIVKEGDRNKGTDWGQKYNRVRIVRDTAAGTIEVFFNNMRKPIMKATDKHFPSGGIGFGSFDDTGNIDDVRIWGKKIEKKVGDKKAAAAK